MPSGRGTGRRFRDHILGADGSEVSLASLFPPRMLLREGEEKFPAVCTASPFTAANKRVREPWRHAPLRGGFLPRSYFGGKTLAICSARPGSTSERAGSSRENRGERRSRPQKLHHHRPLPPKKRNGTSWAVRSLSLN